MGLSYENSKTTPLKVSVILPSLNVADYIADAISSVREQTMNCIEIICVDAGSTDGTRQIIDKQAAEDNRIIVLDSPVKSYGFQVNMGINRAIGDYIGIVETDDFVHPEMYEALYSMAIENNLDYVKCDYDTYTFNSEGQKTFSGRRISENREYYDKTFVPIDHPDTAFEDWYLWNGIYRTEFLRENVITFSERRGAVFQDIGFLHKTVTKAKAARYLNRSLYRYCVGRSDASSNSDRTIFYIRDEYGFLINGMGDAGNINEWKHLYRRMAKSFARSCMVCSDDMLRSNQAREICRWFQKRLLSAENSGFISSDVLPSGLRETYLHLTDPVSGYLAYRRDRLRYITDFIGKGHPVVIFGCGVYGREAYAYLTGIGYSISCFMDNSENLWGKTMENTTIEKPDKIKDYPTDTRYVIANENHAEEILSQIEADVERERIYIY